MFPNLTDSLEIRQPIRKFTDPAKMPFIKVTVWGDAPSVKAVRWLSKAQQMQAAVMSNAEVIPEGPWPKEETTPAISVSATPIHVFLSSFSLKTNSPIIAVATNSIFNQIETEAAFAVFSPANKNKGAINPPKKIMPRVLPLLPV